MTTMPTWEEYMTPSLRVLSDGTVHRARDVYAAAADDLGVTEEQRDQLIPSGQPRYINRALWALSYLFRAGAADRPSRGHYAITETGRQLLAEHPAMGCGGADGAATRTQSSNDGGIDGIIDQDALGLSRVYVQAKRYALDAAVGRPEIQGFVGALARVRGTVRADNHPRHAIRAEPHRRLLRPRQGAAHRDLGRHARYRHRRA